VPAEQEFDQQVRLTVMRHFVDTGAPPAPVDLAADLAVAPVQVEQSYRRLADGRIFVLASGSTYIWMANPLSALPTPFRVFVGGRRWWAPCIWDALGAVAMLGGTGRVETRCPDCAENLTVEVDDGRVQGSGIVHFSVPARHWWDDIGFN